MTEPAKALEALEEWKVIPGWENYSVSNMGRVKSQKKVLKPSIGPNDYLSVTLRRTDERKTFTIHKIVMLTFVGPRPDGMVTRHVDGDKYNNRLDNLTYGTPKENTHDRVAHGTMHYGEDINLSKLTTEQVIEIRMTYKRRHPDFGQKALAAKYGVHLDTIARILAGTLWGHLPTDMVQQRVDVSGIKGVNYKPRDNRWVARFKEKHLGSFDTREEAAAARYKAENAHTGDGG